MGVFSQMGAFGSVGLANRQRRYTYKAARLRNHPTAPIYFMAGHLPDVF